MVDVSKVRYAAIVAIIGLAVALIPGLTETAQEWIQALSLVVGGLWSFLRIAGEFFKKPQFEDADFFTQSRGAEDGGFWATVKRAW